MFLTQMVKKTLWGGCGKCLWVRGGAGWVGTIGWVEWKGQGKNDWKER